ncbi:MAG TPA: hypothetical protein PK006_02745 [Saprospiraceae bacterium]|nr:hypothetical protein [Saprospiraceae bacterium]
MKFSNYLTQIADVSIYPVISLLLFVCFFVLVTYWTYKFDANEIKEIENIPFDDRKTK